MTISGGGNAPGYKRVMGELVHSGQDVGSWVEHSELLCISPLPLPLLHLSCSDPPLSEFSVSTIQILCLYYPSPHLGPPSHVQRPRQIKGSGASVQRQLLKHCIIRRGLVGGRLKKVLLVKGFSRFNVDCKRTLIRQGTSIGRFSQGASIRGHSKLMTCSEMGILVHCQAQS